MALAKIEREMAASGKGCLGKASDDEPVFILRAQDKLAPAIVEAWAMAAAAERSRNIRSVQEDMGLDSKIKEARALAHTMRAWQEINYSKLPD